MVDKKVTVHSLGKDMRSHGNRMHSHGKQRNGCQKFDSETETNRYVTIILKLII